MSAPTRTRRETGNGNDAEGEEEAEASVSKTNKTWKLTLAHRRLQRMAPGASSGMVHGGILGGVCQQTKGPCQPPDPRILFPDTNGSAGLAGTLHDWQTEQGPTHRRQAQIQTGGLAPSRRRQTESRGLRPRQTQTSKEGEKNKGKIPGSRRDSRGFFSFFLSQFYPPFNPKSRPSKLPRDPCSESPQHQKNKLSPSQLLTQDRPKKAHPQPCRTTPPTARPT